MKSKKIRPNFEQNSDQIPNTTFTTLNTKITWHIKLIIQFFLQITLSAFKMSSIDLAKVMEVDPGMIFDFNNTDDQDSEVIINMDEEEAKILLQEDEEPASTKTRITNISISKTNIANDLTTINVKDLGSSNYPHLVMIKAAYTVRNVAFLNETDSIQVVTTTCQTRVNFHTRESW